MVPFLYHNLIRHKVPVGIIIWFLVAHQQYGAAAGAPGAAAAAVNIEQNQYKAPSPASAAVAAVVAAVITGIKWSYSSKYHNGTWYVLHNTDHCTAVRIRIRTQSTYSDIP